jgi:putative transposase
MKDILSKQILRLLFDILGLFKRQSDLVLENLALRQQLSIYHHTIARPRIRRRDRIIWVLFSKLWKDWRDALIFVKPQTVLRWHKRGFKLFWRFKSRQRGPGRPPLESKTRKLIEDMAKANPLWGAPRIHGELLKLGIDYVSERTVSNIIRKCRPPKPPSQTWRTFLNNHMHNTLAIDFFTVPTATFTILYVFVIIHHERREMIHFNVTDHPTAEWTAQQIVEACPWDAAPKYLLRDRDGIYGTMFQNRIKNLGINEVRTSRKSPWQNPYVERLIGSIRRDCLDHIIVLNEEHLKRVLTDYFEYYHHDRTHLGLEKDTPSERLVQQIPGVSAEVISLPRVGGLHHRYEWKKAA